MIEFYVVTRKESDPFEPGGVPVAVFSEDDSHGPEGPEVDAWNYIARRAAEDASKVWYSIRPPRGAILGTRDQLMAAAANRYEVWEL